MKRTPQGHADAVARVEVRKRQVVIRKVTGDSADPFHELTEKEITAKAQMAIKLMGNEGDEQAAQVEFPMAKKLPKGGALLVTCTEEAAKWLRDPRMMGRLADKLGGSAVASADLCMVIAEYMPTTFMPEAFAAFNQVERDSRLEKGAISEARYIKKIENRADGQRNTHMISGLADPDQANLAIRQGLVIEGKSVSVRRHKIDPRRCLKCQQIATHIAAECKSIHEVCRRCTGMHCTAT